MTVGNSLQHFADHVGKRQARDHPGEPAPRRVKVRREARLDGTLCILAEEDTCLRPLGGVTTPVLRAIPPPLGRPRLRKSDTTRRKARLNGPAHHDYQRPLISGPKDSTTLPWRFLASRTSRLM